MPIFVPSASAIPERDKRALWVTGQHGYYTASDSGVVLYVSGLLDNLTLADDNSSQVNSAEGNFFKQNADAFGTALALIFGSNIFSLNQLPLVNFKWSLDQTTNTRFVSILTNQGILAVTGDVLLGAAVGVQYSSTRGDTTFQFIANDDAGTQIEIDSGIPVDTNIHFTQIETLSATETIVRLLDENFIIQASQTFNDTQLFPITTTVGIACGLRNTLAIIGVQSVNQFYGSIILQNS